MEPLRTARLELVPADPELARRLADDPPALGAALAARVPAEWPPPTLDEAAIAVLRRRIDDRPDEQGWWLWFVLEREPRRLIGAVGCYGPPEPDGAVEIGYCLVPSAWGAGRGTEAVGALLAWAFRHRDVSRVRAHTLPDGTASQRLLARHGFVPGGEPLQPGTIRYDLERAAWREPS